MSSRRALPCSAASVPRLTLGVFLLAATGAQAGEFKVPQKKPEIVMDIPDGWTIDQSKSGFELRSPEKNSIVVGRMMGRDKKVLDSWSKEAAEKLKAFGVKFDPNAKGPPPKPAGTSKPTEAATPAETAKPAEPPKTGEPSKTVEPAKPTEASKPAEKTSAFTTDPDQFTFSGAPSLRAPGTEGSNNPVKPGENSIESLTGLGTPGGLGGNIDVSASKLPKVPFHAVQIFGTTLGDKPVDVQIVIYNLPNNRVFVMMQESGSDDGRAVAMAQSVRRAK